MYAVCTSNGSTIYSSPAQLMITLPISNENISIIFAIEEKSNFIAMNMAIQPSVKPIKYPIVAFIYSSNNINEVPFLFKTKL